VSRPLSLLLGLAIAFAMPAVALAAKGDPRAAVQSAYVAGDYARARELLAPLLAANPTDPDLLRRRALIEAAEKNFSAAQATIDKAAALDPGDADIRLARASILLWRGQIGAARREADALSATQPAYPGLSELHSGIARAEADRAVHLAAVSVGGSLSRARFASGLERTWSVQRASAAVGWGDGAVATLEGDREKRNAADTRIGARVDLPVGGGRVFLSGSVTPDPDFRESWSIVAGGEAPLAAGATLLLDARYADYRTQDVSVIGLGARFRPSGRFSLTARSIHLLGGGETYRLGGSLRADYEPDSAPALFAIVASYPDTEIDGTRQLWSVAGGARIALDRNFVLGLSAEHESRKDSYRRTGVSIDLGWRVGL
jgi:YaiO family outer membrane protein